VCLGEIETEETKTRAAVATYLRDLADRLDEDGDVSLDLGGTKVLLNPTHSVTFELVWWRDAQTAEEARQDVR
jgi:amphi-Trp domain-containing protein